MDSPSHKKATINTNLYRKGNEKDSQFKQHLDHSQEAVQQNTRSMAYGNTSHIEPLLLSINVTDRIETLNVQKMKL
jgi:hypothetical protein